MIVEDEVMRIKFRAWKRVNTPEMFNDVQAIDFKSGMAHLGYKLSSFTERTDKERLENLILMQYTGLKDTHGVEIYEGDIVEYHDSSIKSCVISPVYWSAPMFVVESGLLYFKSKEDNKVFDGRIIGNIYENPELLGDSQ